MDVRNLQFDDATFDVAIDKGQELEGRLALALFNPLNRYDGCHDDCKRGRMGPT